MSVSVKDVDIVRSRETKQIIIPAEMKLKDVSDWCLRKDREEDKEVKVFHQIDCFPLDGAVAFRAALDEIYGFVENRATPGWFGPEPPAMIGVQVGPDKTVQVPWGRVAIPNVAGYLETAMTGKPHPQFIITGQTKQRHLPEIEEIVAKTREKLATASIYKGKAVRLDLSWMRLGGRFDPTAHAPKFTIPVDKVDVDQLIFSQKVWNDISLGLFTPIEHADSCRRHGIPLKRGVLLAGQFGTGKTLTAYVTAKKAVDNGWTFIYLGNVLDLAMAFKFAAQYAPAVVFAEDVDRVVGGEERTEEIDAVLNSFDGVDTKDKELVTVLTTNHLEKLTPAILRPGRCDTLVEVTRPDAEAAIRLVKLYGRGLFHPDTNYDRIGNVLADHFPAEIREAVERAKLAAVRRLPGESILGHLREQDVVAAVQAMESQHKLLTPKEKDTRGVAEKCADIIGSRMADALSDGASRNTAAVINVLQALGHSPDDMATAANALPAHAGNGQSHDEDDDE